MYLQGKVDKKLLRQILFIQTQSKGSGTRSNEDRGSSHRLKNGRLIQRIRKSIYYKETLLIYFIYKVILHGVIYYFLNEILFHCLYYYMLLLRLGDSAIESVLYYVHKSLSYNIMKPTLYSKRLAGVDTNHFLSRWPHHKGLFSTQIEQSHISTSKEAVCARV